MTLHLEATFNKDRWKLLRKAMADKKLRDGAKNVLTVMLTQFSGKSTGRAKCSDEDIAAALGGIKIDTVYRHIKALEGRGYVMVPEGERRGSLYCFGVPDKVGDNHVKTAPNLGHMSDSEAETQNGVSDKHPTISDICPSRNGVRIDGARDVIQKQKEARDRKLAETCPVDLFPVEPGSHEAATWDAFLAHDRRQALVDVALHVDGLLLMPSPKPPSNDEWAERKLAKFLHHRRPKLMLVSA